MKLHNLKKILIDKGCKTVYVKNLSPNDNSKNQVYLGGSFDILNIFPITKIETVAAGDWKRERFRASINFSWINDEGNISKAPHAKFILYPKYPEVRFSGFLKGSAFAPSDLMTQRLADRLLFLSVAGNGEILGFVTHPESVVAKEFEVERDIEEYGVFSVINLSLTGNSRDALLKELARICKLEWIPSKRLSPNGMLLDCESPNCGGYTLEAELGITPNGFSKPDYLGWEIKQFGVKTFEQVNSAVITLMTPEPTNGIYKSLGAEYFVRKYGYPDKMGRKDRLNFGGIHKVGRIHETTQLELKLIGYDEISGKIRNTDGKIVLLDRDHNEAASWSFSSLLLHWNRKHNKACYIPSIMCRKGMRRYKYGCNVILGVGTDFQLFLTQMARGNIYYDPGIKIENISSNPKIKKRSQFRMKSRYIQEIYKDCEIVDLSG